MPTPNTPAPSPEYVVVRKRTYGRNTRTGRIQTLVASVYHRPGCRHIPDETRMDRTWAYTYDVSTETPWFVARELWALGRRLTDGGAPGRGDLRPCGACRPPAPEDVDELATDERSYGVTQVDQPADVVGRMLAHPVFPGRRSELRLFRICGPDVTPDHGEDGPR